MKKLILSVGALLLAANLFAQAPQKMTYQAVVRNASNAIVSNAGVGLRISILQDNPSGIVVYSETHQPTTNANGLFSIQLGGGTVQSGTFSTINWANDEFFVKTEIDPAGGTNYSITNTTQFLSVPYAFHAKTAESVSGPITVTETDPAFTASPAAGIASGDIANWNNKQDLLTAGTNVTITGNVISAASGITSELDPAFTASPAAGIASGDITNWNNKQDQLTAGTNVTITGNVISAASGITSELDPAFTASPAAGIVSGDITNWNNKQDQLTAGTNITISGNVISATGGSAGNQDIYEAKSTGQLSINTIGAYELIPGTTLTVTLQAGTKVLLMSDGGIQSTGAGTSFSIVYTSIDVNGTLLTERINTLANTGNGGVGQTIGSYHNSTYYVVPTTGSYTFNAKAKLDSQSTAAVNVAGLSSEVMKASLKLIIIK